MSIIEQTKKEKIKPKLDIYPKWTREQEPFDNPDAKGIDSNGKEFRYFKPENPQERDYQIHFLNNVVDKDGNYHPKRNDKGIAVKTTPNNAPKHTINCIYRIKRRDGSQFLYSQGHFHGYDALGNPVRYYVSMPEKWMKTNFNYKRGWNEHTSSVERLCEGIGMTETMYELPFNEKNLKQLWDKRESDDILLVVKEEQSGIARTVLGGPSMDEKFKLFLKDFNHLFTAEYISMEKKMQYRQEAVDAGFLSASQDTFPGLASTKTTAPPKGTYS
jgi:hypothetical protein